MSQNNAINFTNELLCEAVKYNAKGYSNKLWYIYNVLLFDLHLNENADREVKKVVKIFKIDYNVY